MQPLHTVTVLTLHTVTVQPLHIAQSHSFICTQEVGDLAGIVTGGVLHSGARAWAAGVMGHLEHLNSSQEVGGFNLIGVRSKELGVRS